MKQLSSVACGLLVAVGLWVCATHQLVQHTATASRVHTLASGTGVAGGGPGGGIDEIEWP